MLIIFHKFFSLKTMCNVCIIFFYIINHLKITIDIIFKVIIDYYKGKKVIIYNNL